MVVEQVFKAYLYPDPLSALEDGFNIDNGIDITEGILNINIISGNEIYEGPQQQIDTGQFTIVTRNPAMDPKINPDLKYNSAIKFYDERSGEFFRGYVTDVQVQYQRKDDPIITITGTDIFGAMQRVVVSQATHDTIMALSTGPTWNGITFSEFLPYMYDFTSKYLDLDAITPANYPDPQGFWFDATQGFAEQYVGNLGYSPAKYIPNVGESYLDIINKYAQTNLTYFSARGEFGYDYINVYSFPKYDPNFWAPQQDPITEYTTYDFSSDPADERPYESILIDNGYNRVINQVDISNEYRYVEDGELKSTTEGFTRLSNESIEEYAISRASVSTIYPEDNPLSNSSWANRYSTNIFQVTQYPGQEIQQITFDNARPEDIENEFSYSAYDLHQIVRIKHEINETETIDRVYDIAGISHNIAPDKWEMSFTLKPSKQEVVFNFQGQLPTIEMNALSGDSNFNFTATITAFDTTTVGSVVWALSAVDANEIAEIWPYATSGNMFKDGLPRTGLTQTWNFDDDGILAPYSFDPDSTYPDPLDNRYGNYGTGTYYVYAYIFLNNQFVICLQQELTVGTPEVEADFGWVQNLTNNFGQVTFTDTSVNNETGEADSFLWDFGDGTTSALRNPVKIYVPIASENSYNVSLTVFAYGEGGAKVYNTHTETVTLAQPTMVPNFTFGASGATVQFINTSTNVGFEEPDAYLWNFGDGTTTTVKNPVKIYSGNENEAVTFNVTLTTRNIWEQTASITQAVTLTPINNTGTFPVQRIKLSSATDAQSQSSARMQPYMFFLKGLTSGTLVNELYLKPTTKTNSSNIVWYEADGTTDETNDSLNLTRDPSITPTGQYGLSPAKTDANSGSFELITDLGSPKFNINNLKLTFRDYELNNANRWSPGINVSVADATGPFYDIGYFKTPQGKVVPEGTGITEVEKTIILARSLPLKTPYFTWTFDGNRTVTFNSIETAENYNWLTGTGYTMEGKNPTYTYVSTGAGEQHKFTVQLSVSNGGVVTRTSSATIYLPYLAPYPVRYVRLKQRFYDGASAYDTPYLRNFSVWDKNNKLIPTVTPQWGRVVNTYSNDGSGFYTGTSTSPTLINNSLLTATTLTQTQLTSSDGIRVRGDTAFNRTEWYALIDFKNTFNNIGDFTFDAAKISMTSPSAGGVPTYEVWVTDYVGNDAVVAGNSTYLQVGTITPTNISSTFKTFGIIRTQ